MGDFKEDGTAILGVRGVARKLTAFIADAAEDDATASMARLCALLTECVAIGYPCCLCRNFS